MNLRLSMLCIAAILSFGGVGDADELPLPGDVKRLQKPYEVLMGSQAVQVQGFSTSLSVERLRTFYEQALPNNGWKVAALPWLAQFQRQNETVRQEALPDADERVRQAVQHQLYAVQGAQRVLLSFSPQRAQTLVFVNRWHEPDGQALMGSVERPGQGVPAETTGWSLKNPCCSGESVPTALRKLPGSIPPYPNGRMVSTGAAPDQRPGQGVMSETYLTDDSALDVAAYYRSHMAYNGWSSVEVPPGSVTSPQLDQMLSAQGMRFDMQGLAFRNEGGICGIAVVESGSAPAQGPGAQAAQQAPQAPMERTLITVTYVKSLSLGKPRRATQAPEEGARKP